MKLFQKFPGLDRVQGLQVSAYSTPNQERNINNMRLDKYLKVSRIIKRRTVANEACDAGRVEINGKVAKASVDVKIGDNISIRFGDKTSTFEVVEVKETVRKEDAQAMYRVV